MKLQDVITPEELRDNMEAVRKGGQAEALKAADLLRDYGLALSGIMKLPDFMLAMGILEAIRRAIENKAKPIN